MGRLKVHLVGGAVPHSGCHERHPPGEVAAYILPFLAADPLRMSKFSKATVAVYEIRVIGHANQFIRPAFSVCLNRENKST